MSPTPPQNPDAPFVAHAHDRWLERWLPRLRERTADAPVLEIGCGYGEDSATLCAAGFALTAFDLDAECVAAAQARAPQARIFRHDTREPWPCAPASLGAVVASLSLHYFDWATTEVIVARIHAALRPGGILLCRLNSTEDHHYGASGHPEIEAHYYRVDGQPKRFFDRTDLEQLFAQGWRVLDCTHGITGKYAHPKAQWEIVLEKADV